jgi:hypothetical protein
MKEYEISDERYEQEKENVKNMLFTDLVLERNNMLNNGNINNRLYELYDSEIKRRRIGYINEEQVSSKGRSR